MGDFNSLRLAFRNGASGSGDWLRVEQPEIKSPGSESFISWALANDKEITLATVAQYLEEFSSACNEDGSCEIELEVHKGRPDLPYVFRESYGELSARYVHTTKHKTSVAIGGESEIELDYYVVGAVKAFWEGPVFAMDGTELVPKPAIVHAAPGARTLSVLATEEPVKVVGVVRLEFTEQHDAYVLTIHPRPKGEYEEDDPEGAYQSSVIAFWDGGYQLHEVDLPEMKGYCSGNSGSVRVDPDEDGDGEDDGDGTGEDGQERCYKHIVLMDPCTQKVINEWDEEVPCDGGS